MWSRSAAFQRAARKPSTDTKPKKNTKTEVATTFRWSNMLSSYQPGPRQELRGRKSEQEQAGTRRKRGCRKGQAGSSCKAGPRVREYREQATERTSLSPRDQRKRHHQRR